MGILEGLDREDNNSLPEGIGFLPAKYGSDPRQGSWEGHDSRGGSEHKLDVKRARQGDCLFMKNYVVLWSKNCFKRILKGCTIVSNVIKVILIIIMTIAAILI